MVEEGARVIEPQVDRVYVVELCSGERRHWRFLGHDGQDFACWRDEDSGRSFSEASVMYAWEIVGTVDAADP